MKGYVIALDQGTTSSRAIVFNRSGEIVSLAQYDYPQIYPRPGWVEHDPADILGTQIHALSDAFAKSGVEAADIAAIGVTNQRETTLVWDRTTGKPVYNAIVWQCRRTAAFCDHLAAEGVGAYIRDKTGLLIDAYFSGTKIRWILENVPGARERAERGELIFGTVDSWLIWNLTGGREHISDYSNCSRTMLFDIDRLRWDEDLCRVLGVPMSMLPAPVPSSAEYGRVAPGIKGLEALAGVPICGSAGDQAAALLDQVEAFAAASLAERGTRLAWCSDEFYLLAGRALPERAYYEELAQLENGVGMLRLLTSQAGLALEDLEPGAAPAPFSIATGVSAAPFLQEIVDKARKKCSNIRGTVYPIRNRFFGETITVAGLVTGGDLIRQLKGRTAPVLLIPDAMLRHEKDRFLDDVQPGDVERELGVELRVVPVDGAALLQELLR